MDRLDAHATALGLDWQYLILDQALDCPEIAPPEMGRRGTKYTNPFGDWNGKRQQRTDR